MKKFYLLANIPTFIGIGCFLAFTIIGSEVTPDGILIEAFYLIPIGYIFILMWILASLVLWIYTRIKNKKITS